MAKTTSPGGTSGNSMMAGGKGMSARKAIAGAGYGVKDSGGSSFGVQSFADGAVNHGGHHPDHTAGSSGNTLADNARGIGDAVKHTKGHHPAQAAPDHGPMHPNGYMDHGRGV